MLNGLYEKLGPTPTAIIAISIILITGFLMTRITSKLKLPNVTAYIVAGILIGPFCLNFIPETVVKGTEFLPDIALAFIAFSTGEFFSIDALRHGGAKVIVITLFESLMASLLIFILTFVILGMPMSFAIVLSALAAATAPASTMMTIRQTGAKGPFVNTLLQVVALDDIVSLVAYSIAISVAVAFGTGAALKASSVLLPILYNIAAITVGSLFGWFLKLALSKSKSSDNRLIVAIAFLFAFCGLCTLVGVSPLLGCMMMGMVYKNTANDDKLFKQLNYYSPPLLLIFFVRSGVSFDLNALIKPSGVMGSVPLLLIGILYFFVRIGGKYLGAFTGCAVTKQDKKIRNNLGLALIPQAGVAIGLAALGARTLGGDTGNALQTIILASSVLYELVGPACAKLSLSLSKSYSDNIDDIKVEDDKKNEVEKLIERINKIKEEMPKREDNSQEEAFNEAAEEWQNARRPQMKNRRF